ncbi:hypothetical protein F2Q69_00059273 [Brassica cretica]|uniref:RNase H type-1 domain-containing protein n=1 Tax=Brassica cretica TaxID=69181 RepID=A0A8S9RSU5_BRACR|nr:hypothetical protein F2Q69_00059273 [Brassica cretica]
MEEADEPLQHPTPRAQAVREHRYTCQVDGSWAGNEAWMGSPLHAEAEGIIWAMQEARERGFDDIMFVSDCQQLINLACKEEEWPSIAAELDEIKLWRSKFNNVALSFVPRSDNFRADSLAKGGRSRAQCFSYVNSLVPFWPAPEARLNEPV